jgi:hypothetical protein
MQVLEVTDVDPAALRALLARYGLELVLLSEKEAIPGSHWGESEAGLVDNRLYARPDTPVHSVLHESCHYICMSPARRQGLHTDAGGDDAEENAVCYLQVVLADQVPGFGRARQFADMDAWGYSFRLGSAQRWFEEDADDARQWLIHRELIDGDERPTWKLHSIESRLM